MSIWHHIRIVNTIRQLSNVYNMNYFKRHSFAFILVVCFQHFQCEVLDFNFALMKHIECEYFGIEAYLTLNDLYETEILNGFYRNGTQRGSTSRNGMRWATEAKNAKKDGFTRNGFSMFVWQIFYLLNIKYKSHYIVIIIFNISYTRFLHHSQVKFHKNDNVFCQ